MGTRCLVTIKDECFNELVTVYRQFDGYPSGMGADLAELCNVTLINGIGYNQTQENYANGMGCLAAKIIAGLKTGIGNVYIDFGEGNHDDVDYFYTITGNVGEVPTIECMSYDGHNVYTGTAKQWLNEYLNMNAEA